MCSAYPEMLNNIPLTRRALQSWDRLAITGEGQATSFEACAVIAQNLRQNGQHDAADICLIPADMYLRLQDWQNLRREDIVGGQLGSSLSESDLSGIAVLLGVLARGRDHQGWSTTRGTS